ncbi:uncharacterized protein LY89DRAFT_740678 [Mollisia scopiformis]|uniref:Uncharacterized protein n=1 Tax=Mollisia scopiformis TaxID=149040 RepID=A0A132BB07_MOLSC|nr:uncharacterized protein LY89DRAFT_740678 [Mollisia scopiformis]KUJ09595.1 hypothetical protein LY89DRAFT_740678 [Mollisia scopiformis]
MSESQPETTEKPIPLNDLESSKATATEGTTETAPGTSIPVNATENSKTAATEETIETLDEKTPAADDHTGDINAPATTKTIVTPVPNTLVSINDFADSKAAATGETIEIPPPIASRPGDDIESNKAATNPEDDEKPVPWPIPQWVKTSVNVFAAGFLSVFAFLFSERSGGRGFMLWLFCGLLLIPHGFLVYRWPHGDYGIGVLNSHFFCGAHGEGFMIFLIQLPINVMASLIVYAAGYVRWKAWWPLKVVLFLLSIPAHLLYNSIFFHSAPARDSYEILVSYDFLHGGAPFDLATVPLRQSSGKSDALGGDYHMMLPGLQNLSDTITQVQQAAMQGHVLPGWSNKTIKKCTERYESGTYDQFSNVIIVSNWTAPQNQNNSVLDLTILSGYAGPKHQTWQALASLCPDSFFEINNLTEPKTWKNIDGNAPEGACDPYVPKKWNTKEKNLFIKYCLSEEPKEVCRLLYSPLVLKLCFWFLVAIVGAMGLGLLLGLFGVEEEYAPQPETGVIVLAFATVCVSFFVMVIVTAYSRAAHWHPAGKSDQAWILRAFCVVNVVQLIDTICDAIIVPWGTSPWYTLLSIVWHWFLSGTFSLKLSDRYLITNTPPGYDVVPYSDLSSLWFKWLFVTVIKLVWTDLFSLLFVLFLFGLPFAARLFAQQAILEEDFDGWGD